MNINNYSTDIYKKNTLSMDILGVIQKHIMKSEVQYEILYYIYSRKH